MKKHFLGSAAILALMTTAAIADNNEADVEQLGNLNTASVSQQNGSSNGAWLLQDGNRNDFDIEQSADTPSGNSWGGNEVGTDTNAASQLGNRNTATISQGTSGNEVGTRGQGFVQTGNGNSADIDQQSGGNRVNQLVQDSENADGGANVVEVEQGAPRPGQNVPYNNVISSISQERTGAGGANRISVDQGSKFARIGQSGGAGTTGGGLEQLGNGNVMGVTQDREDAIRSVIQDNSASAAGGNRASITQDGTNGAGNDLQQITQSGGGNRLTIIQDGASNSEGTNFTSGGMAQAVRAASAAQVSEGDVLQFGDGNVLRYTITGDENLFGSKQQGSGNIARASSIVGDRNELAIWQQGNDSVAVVTHDGSDNDIGIAQYNGDINNAAVRIRADGDGSSDNNHAGVVQNGGGNTFDLSIRGDDNNDDMFTAVDTMSLATMAGLTVGQFNQNGNGNDFGADIRGDGNLIGALQDGNDNVADGSITGSFNEVAIAQVGNTNMTSFNQLGSSNSIAVSQ